MTAWNKGTSSQLMNKSAKDPVKIQTMFSTIAYRYDLLNRVLSLGLDRYWRRFAISLLPEIENARFLDVATGTGDLAIEAALKYPDISVTGVDFVPEMLEMHRDITGCIHTIMD